MSRNTQEARASGYQSSKSTNTSGKTLATIQSGVEIDGAETKRVGPRRGSSRWSTSGTGSSGSKMTDSANSSSRFSKLAKSTRSLLRLSSTKGDAFFKSSSDATPAWLAARRLSTRSVSHAADHRSDDDITLYGTKREEVEELDKAETAATARSLPKGMLDDGFVIPSFEVKALQDLGDQPAGRGCQAYIWRCIVPEGKFGGQVCALKVLREDQNMTEEDRHSFVREAHLLARMTSPYVLKALGGSETVDKLPCILLEWCDTDATRALRLKDVGASSAARREVMTSWPSMERLRLMRELASALEFLHSGDAIAGRVAIVHRDLKPDNIGINGAGRVKLLGARPCGNHISDAPRHRRDVVPVTAAQRWRGDSTPSTRRCPHRFRAGRRDSEG
jgi:hypothetical protein